MKSYNVKLEAGLYVGYCHTVVICFHTVKLIKKNKLWETLMFRKVRDTVKIPITQQYLVKSGSTQLFRKFVMFKVKECVFLNMFQSGDKYSATLQ